MKLTTREEKRAFQEAFLKKAGPNFIALKQLMDTLPHTGFYIKDCEDRIITLNNRNCEISALRDEFDAIGRKSSDLFPGPIGQACLERDALVRTSDQPTIGGINEKTVDRDPVPTIYSVFPLHDNSGHVIGTMCAFYSSQRILNHPTHTRKQLQIAVDHLVAHPSEPVALAQLAQLSGLSETHFRRLFRETLQESPAKYALRLRLNNACRALEGTNDTIAEIAADNGFFDQSHFVKAFRHHFGRTPTEYRRNHQHIISGPSRDAHPSAAVESHAAATDGPACRL